MPDNEYSFKEIEKKWQHFWAENKTYQTAEDPLKPKYYVLDMFPYPSGSGLHVGHPLGYIASDIVARYKRQKGFNVLHPMGYDAFGLPAEQYAIQTGKHPAKTTAENISRYRQQLDNIGFSFDWDRSVSTADPSYYKWTQWIFIQLFKSWYNPINEKAEYIESLKKILDSGNLPEKIKSFYDFDNLEHHPFNWQNSTAEQKEKILMQFRLAYLDFAFVNWCPALGTVLANEEVINGLSERGGHPVERIRMRQWMLRITAYADRLLTDLNQLDWSESIKEIQRNWIGKSNGAEVDFTLENGAQLKIFTTRPDTIFGCTFMVIAPEHEWAMKLAKPERINEVSQYIEKAKNRSERERITDVKSISGVFTGSYAINPVSGEKIPVWIADYVLAGYGTGAIMAVPAHDERDFAFAKTFDLPLRVVVKPNDSEVTLDNQTEAYHAKDGVIINSGFINGLSVSQAIDAVIRQLETDGKGKSKTNFKLRDAGFSRQRYWGEPFPIIYKNEIPYCLDESQLPVELPAVESYKPSGNGESPLAAIKEWVDMGDGFRRETNTMPGYAGSSWYFLRYMDPKNTNKPFDKAKVDYWQNVDLYIGGAEHATGHLLYSRFWMKFFKDMGWVNENEPFKKLINQGHIQGENGEKMSKSKGNVVNPDEVIENYGADTLRLYEMFLGPLEQSKPWSTTSIEGVHRFLKKVWRLFYDNQGNFLVTNEKPSKEESRIINKTIKKVEDDINRLSFNTAVSSLMICCNELQDLNCHKKEILESFTVILSSFAPHLCEELWFRLGHHEGITQVPFPKIDEAMLTVDEYQYAISINGKVRTLITFPTTATTAEIEPVVLENEIVKKWLDGKAPKKIIVVPKKIVNVVL